MIIQVNGGNTEDIFQNSNVSGSANRNFYLRALTALTTTSTPAYSFVSDNDTGMGSPSANNLNFSTGGIDALALTSSQNIGISSSSPQYKLTIGNFAGASIRLGTTTVPYGGYTQPIEFDATTTVNGSKTFDWVNEAGGPTFTVPPTVTISADYTQDAVTLLQCNPSSRTTTTVIIGCVSIADGVTAVVNTDATNRIINVHLSGY